MKAIITARSIFNGYAAKNRHSPFKVKPILLAAALAVGLVAQPAQAALSFTFKYDSSGIGFSDTLNPGLASARRDALTSAAGMLGAYFTEYNAELVYNVTSYNNSDNTLASAGSPSTLNPGAFRQTFVQAKILTNGSVDDRSPEDANGNINWNFFYNWGLSDNPTGSEYDLKSTAIHELLHTFGFSSNIGAGGTGLGGIDPTSGNPDTWAIFDKYLITAGTGMGVGGIPLIGAGGVFNTNAIDFLTAGTLNNPGVLFNGANAVAANGGNPIPVYSPSASGFESGSSISHLDDGSTVTSNLIMNAKAQKGLETRTLSAIEIGILKDIGYTKISAVPVPAAIWFMGSGLLALFGFSRRSNAA